MKGRERIETIEKEKNGTRGRGGNGTKESAETENGTIGTGETTEGRTESGVGRGTEEMKTERGEEKSGTEGTTERRERSGTGERTGTGATGPSPSALRTTIVPQ